MTYRNLAISIERNVVGGYRATDNRSQVMGFGSSEAEALLEYYAAAVQANVFDADDLTPLLQRVKLLWPTDFKVYTQRFGERPEFYAKFRLPGHEGVDIRAPFGAPVRACARGVVTMAGWHPKRGRDHPYGFQVRIRHVFADGEYETIYAHLREDSAVVKVGDEVHAGIQIASADSTGNSSAAHLHLSLKKIGAKNGGYGELIDPAPFFVDGPFTGQETG